MAWAVWLAAPIGATVLAALWVWARGWAERRASRPLDTEAAVRAHERYLEALTVPPRGQARPERREPGGSEPTGSGLDGSGLDGRELDGSGLSGTDERAPEPGVSAG